MPKNIKIQGILFSLFFMFVIVSPAVISNWTFPPIVTIGPGDHPFMTMDSNNKMHIVFCYCIDSNPSLCSLRYTTNSSGSWITSSVDSSTNTGFGPEATVDSNGKVHISYYEGGTYDTRYATNASGSWVASTIGSSGDSYGGAVATDSNNKVHLAYTVSNYGILQYATNASGPWIISTIDGVLPMIGGYRSVAVDSQNKVHIAYCLDNASGATLKYATNASGSWVVTTVDNSAQNVVTRMIDPTAEIHTRTSIAVDSNDKVHISYGAPSLTYATNKTGDWVISLSIRESSTKTDVLVD